MPFECPVYLNILTNLDTVDLRMSLFYSTFVFFDGPGWTKTSFPEIIGRFLRISDIGVPNSSFSLSSSGTSSEMGQMPAFSCKQIVGFAVAVALCVIELLRKTQIGIF